MLLNKVVIFAPIRTEVQYPNLIIISLWLSQESSRSTVCITHIVLWGLLVHFAIPDFCCFDLCLVDFLSWGLLVHFLRPQIVRRCLLAFVT